MVAKIEGGKVTLYSRNGKIISQSYVEVAQALEGVKADAIIDGELVALDKNGVSHFQLLQNALRHEAKLLYCAFDLMFCDGEDLRKLTLLDRKKRFKDILPRHKLIALSRHRKALGTKFFEEAERKGLEGIMAKRAVSQYLSGARTDNWLKMVAKSMSNSRLASFRARCRRYSSSAADGKPEIVNYRAHHNVLIVDRLFAAAELRLGGETQQRVRIIRSDGGS